MKSDPGGKGGVVWFTGLSGAGKTTVASMVHARLQKAGRLSYVLDGDLLRAGLCSDLGFSLEERTENLRRAFECARMFASSGFVVLCALISPLRSQRSWIRGRCEEEGLPFLEVHMQAPLGICEQRDPKGLYKLARAGKISGFTGLDSPYEPPLSPELSLGDAVSAQAGAEILWQRIRPWLGRACARQF